MSSIVALGGLCVDPTMNALRDFAGVTPRVHGAVVCAVEAAAMTMQLAALYGVAGYLFFATTLSKMFG